MMNGREYTVEKPVHISGKDSDYAGMHSLWFRRNEPLEGEGSIWKTPIYRIK
jgi:hypothetical protein